MFCTQVAEGGPDSRGPGPARRRTARELEAEPRPPGRRAMPRAACAHDAGVCGDSDLGERAAGARFHSGLPSRAFDSESATAGARGNYGPLQ